MHNLSVRLFGVVFRRLCCICELVLAAVEHLRVPGGLGSDQPSSRESENSPKLCDSHVKEVKGSVQGGFVPLSQRFVKNIFEIYVVPGSLFNHIVIQCLIAVDLGAHQKNAILKNANTKLFLYNHV